MAEPQVQILGPIQLGVADQPVGLGATMLRAVLARLVAAGGRATGPERLIDDLWEGNPPPTAASVLQVHIHNLRRLIEPDRPRRAPSRYLVSESSGYALKLAPGSVDAWRFEALLREYDHRAQSPGGIPDLLERRRLLDAVLACWTGDAYEGLTTFGWAAQEADRLTDLRLTAAELRADIELRLNRPAEVAIELRTLFDEHPEREEIARLLATAQYRIGQQAQALATLRRSREYLGAEYGIDPSPALRELETAILAHSETLGHGYPPAPAAGPDSAGGPAPVRIAAARPDTGPGRSRGGPDAATGERHAGPAVRRSALAEPHSGYTREHAAIRAAAAQARGGRLQLVWLAGEAGAGKTTAAEAALAALGDDSWITVRGGCPEVDGAPPAWAWAEILGALAPGTAGGLSGSDAFTIARAVVELCRQRTPTGPVAMLLEDAHRADTATLQVLRQVVSWLREEPVFLVITLRGSEAGPNLHGTAAALAHHTAEWLELTGLDLEATRNLVRDSGITEFDAAAVELLHRRTGGNPLFVRELAKLLAARHGSDDRGELPDSIRELITVRLRRLPAEVVPVLGHLAIWGDGADLRILSRACAVPEDDLIDLIAEAEVAALVRTDRTGRITFDHALIQDAVYLSIPRLRRVRMHWAALELLEQHADEFPGLARDPDMLAHHAILGARPETAMRAVEYALLAARRSTERGMAGDTVRLWQAVIELHELAGHVGEHTARGDRIALLDAHCRLVDALAYQGRWIEASAVRRHAVKLARGLDDRSLLIRALTCWHAPMLYPAPQWPDPEHRVLRAVQSCLDGPLPDADRIRLLAVAAAETAGDYRDPLASQRYARQALALARDAGDPELLCIALNVCTLLRFSVAEDGPLLRELFDVADRSDLNHYRTAGHYGLFRCALAALDLPEACRRIDLTLSTAADSELPQLMLVFGAFTALLALLRGEVDEAERLYLAFDRQADRLKFPSNNSFRTVNLLAVAWARGEVATERDRCRQMYEAAPLVGAPLYGLTLVASGEIDRARAVYHEAAHVPPGIAPTLEYAGRAYLALGLGLAEEYEDLYRILAPHTGTIVGFEATGCTFDPMDTLLGLLAAARGDTERAAAHHEAADRLMRRLRTQLAELEVPELDPTGPRHRQSGILGEPAPT
ncbi:BTAD domain-containing putative transcriptional regulator [Nocardia inohanensis]|uniref:BTAD domain-containing putative transcriptional regulator n=1 Tax=Nocardia inohanensis TaxID=209246 RepID=UPI000B24A360|nr:BTAD domain-containing putative transcriptional regulator [Nocardia inohanensis]